MILLDSSFLIRYHNEDDSNHDAAVEAMTRLAAGEWGTALLPEYVFLEVVTVLAARRGIARAREVGAQILQAREVEFVPCSDLFVRTFDRFRAQRDRTFSFTDAAILEVREARGVDLLLTFDQGFRGVRGLRVVP